MKQDESKPEDVENEGVQTNVKVFGLEKDIDESMDTSQNLNSRYGALVWKLNSPSQTECSQAFNIPEIQSANNDEAIGSMYERPKD